MIQEITETIGEITGMLWATKDNEWSIKKRK